MDHPLATWQPQIGSEDPMPDQMDLPLGQGAQYESGGALGGLEASGGTQEYSNPFASQNADAPTAFAPPNGLQAGADADAAQLGPEQPANLLDDTMFTPPDLSSQSLFQNSSQGQTQDSGMDDLGGFSQPPTAIDASALPLFNNYAEPAPVLVEPGTASVKPGQGLGHDAMDVDRAFTTSVPSASEIPAEAPEPSPLGDSAGPPSLAGLAAGAPPVAADPMLVSVTEADMAVLLNLPNVSVANTAPVIGNGEAAEGTNPFTSANGDAEMALVSIAEEARAADLMPAVPISANGGPSAVNASPVKAEEESDLAIGGADVAAWPTLIGPGGAIAGEGFPDLPAGGLEVPALVHQPDLAPVVFPLPAALPRPEPHYPVGDPEIIAAQLVQIEAQIFVYGKVIRTERMEPELEALALATIPTAPHGPVYENWQRLQAAWQATQKRVSDEAIGEDPNGGAAPSYTLPPAQGNDFALGNGATGNGHHALEATESNYVDSAGKRMRGRPSGGGKQHVKRGGSSAQGGREAAKANGSMGQRRGDSVASPTKAGYGSPSAKAKKAASPAKARGKASISAAAKGKTTASPAKGKGKVLISPVGKGKPKGESPAGAKGSGADKAGHVAGSGKGAKAAALPAAEGGSARTDGGPGSLRGVLPPAKLWTTAAEDGPSVLWQMVQEAGRRPEARRLTEQFLTRIANDPLAAAGAAAAAVSAATAYMAAYAARTSASDPSNATGTPGVPDGGNGSLAQAKNSPVRKSMRGSGKDKEGEPQPPEADLAFASQSAAAASAHAGAAAAAVDGAIAAMAPQLWAMRAFVPHGDARKAADEALATAQVAHACAAAADAAKNMVLTIRDSFLGAPPPETATVLNADAVADAGPYGTPAGIAEDDGTVGTGAVPITLPPSSIRKQSNTGKGSLPAAGSSGGKGKKVVRMATDDVASPFSAQPSPAFQPTPSSTDGAPSSSRPPTPYYFPFPSYPQDSPFGSLAGTPGSAPRLSSLASPLFSPPLPQLSFPIAPFSPQFPFGYSPGGVAAAPIPSAFSPHAPPNSPVTPFPAQDAQFSAVKPGQLHGVNWAAALLSTVGGTSAGGLVTSGAVQDQAENEAVTPAEPESRGTKRAREGGAATPLKHTFSLGAAVEVLSNEPGLKGGWFTGTIREVSWDEKAVLVRYDDLTLDEAGTKPLEEWMPLEPNPTPAPGEKVQQLRPAREAHSSKRREPEGPFQDMPRERRLRTWKAGDFVDVWSDDGWWEGVIQEVDMYDLKKAKVFFPGEGVAQTVRMADMRPSLVLVGGEWVPKESSEAARSSPPGSAEAAKKKKGENSPSGASEDDGGVKGGSSAKKPKLTGPSPLSGKSPVAKDSTPAPSPAKKSSPKIDSSAMSQSAAVATSPVVAAKDGSGKKVPGKSPLSRNGDAASLTTPPSRVSRQDSSKASAGNEGKAQRSKAQRNELKRLGIKVP